MRSQIDVFCETDRNGARTCGLVIPTPGGSIALSATWPRGSLKALADAVRAAGTSVQGCTVAGLSGRFGWGYPFPQVEGLSRDPYRSLRFEDVLSVVPLVGNGGPAGQDLSSQLGAGLQGGASPLQSLLALAQALGGSQALGGALGQSGATGLLGGLGSLLGSGSSQSGQAGPLGALGGLLGLFGGQGGGGPLGALGSLFGGGGQGGASPLGALGSLFGGGGQGGASPLGALGSLLGGGGQGGTQAATIRQPTASEAAQQLGAFHGQAQTGPLQHGTGMTQADIDRENARVTAALASYQQQQQASNPLSGLMNLLGLGSQGGGLFGSLGSLFGMGGSGQGGQGGGGGGGFNPLSLLGLVAGIDAPPLPGMADVFSRHVAGELDAGQANGEVTAESVLQRARALPYSCAMDARIPGMIDRTLRAVDAVAGSRAGNPDATGALHRAWRSPEGRTAVRMAHSLAGV